MECHPTEHDTESEIVFLARAVSNRSHPFTLGSVAAIFLPRNTAWPSLDATSSEEHAASKFRFEEK